MPNRRLLARLVRLGFALLILIALTTAVLLQFEAGRTFVVRSYVRADRAWERFFPLERGRALAGGLDQPMRRVGVLQPVWVDVEPGVRLLLDPGDDLSRTVLVSRTNTWEAEVWSAIESGLADGAVMLDVGAHIGYDTMKASTRVGQSGRVVAFEPNPNTLTILRGNIAASRATNIVVQPIACAEKEQTLTLFDSTPGGNSGSSSLSASNAGDANRAYQVRARPIDDVITELGLQRVDVLKADVEGAELLVLRGAEQTLRRFKPKLVLEVVPRQLENMGTSVQELEAFLKTVGYNTSRDVDYKNKEYQVR